MALDPLVVTRANAFEPSSKDQTLKTKNKENQISFFLFDKRRNYGNTERKQSQKDMDFSTMKVMLKRFQLLTKKCSCKSKREGFEGEHFFYFFLRDEGEQISWLTNREREGKE